MRKRFSKEIEEEIVAKYQSGQYNCNTLGQEYLADKTMINRLLRRHNVSINNNRSQLQRKYSLNEEYFDNIDTEVKAYFFGYLLADGYNNIEKNVISLELHPQDRYILERLNLEINSNRPILDRTQKSGYKSSRLCISSVKISKRFLELGCMKKKSFIVEFPTESQCPKYLLQHFIRGFYDGNGCTKYNYTKKDNAFRPRCGLMSTLNFCNSLKEYLDSFLNFKSYVYQGKDEIGTTLGRWDTSASMVSSLAFLNWLYKDATIYLNRKYEKYLYIKSIQLEKLNQRKSKNHDDPS